MKEFDKNTYVGTVLDSMNAMIYCGKKCTRKVEAQIADFVLCTSISQEFQNGGRYIDMHSSPLYIKPHEFAYSDVKVNGLVVFTESKEKQVRLSINGKPMSNTSTVIEITSHLVLLLDGYFPEEVYVNPNKVLRTCKEWAEFKKALARSCWNRR